MLKLIDLIGDDDREWLERSRLEPLGPIEDYAFTTREQRERDRARYHETFGLQIPWTELEPESILLRDMRRSQLERGFPGIDVQRALIARHMDPWYRPPEPKPEPAPSLAEIQETVVAAIAPAWYLLFDTIEQAVTAAIPVMTMTIENINSIYRRLMDDRSEQAIRARSRTKSARAYRKLKGRKVT